MRASASSPDFRITPGWLVLASMAVTGLLFLSERWRWFSFNEKKGWTVLIAVAGVGVVLVAMLLWWLVALVFRWRFQFGIRTMLILTVAVALPCSWLAVEMKKAREQKTVVDGIRPLTDVWYDYQCDAFGKLDVPEWLRRLLGDDFFCKVVQIPFLDVSDQELEEKLKGLPDLEDLEFYGCKLTGSGLKNVNPSHLSKLGLGSTKVTDDALATIEKFTELEELALGQNHIGDDGLRHLVPLKKLRRLDLGVNWNITNDGLKYLADLTQLEELDLTATGVNDDGLEHLKVLKQLKKLRIDTYYWSDAAISALRQALPNCEIGNEL